MKRVDEFLVELMYDFATFPSDRRRHREITAISLQRARNYKAACGLALAIAMTAVWGFLCLLRLLYPAAPTMQPTTALLTLFTTVIRWLFWISWLAAIAKVISAYISDCERR
jgi:hypothetical protein